MIQNLYVYQIIILLIDTLFIVRTFTLFVRHKKSFRELILATFVWIIIAILGLYPNITNIVAAITGFQLGINALLVFSVITLTFITLKLLLKNDKIENSITKLVRQEAIKKLREDVEKNNKATQ